MKRFFIFFGLLISVSAAAGIVPESRARIAAEAVFGNNVTKSGSSGIILLNPETKAGGPQKLFIYSHDGGGFTIISGDDALSPVLAYSTKGDFPVENIPQNVKGVIDGLENCVKHAREIKLTASAKVQSEWDAIDNGSFTLASSKILVTPLYDQDSPFWDNTPVFSGSHTYSGCVATATAEIMKYHNWPEAGTGVIPAYTTNSRGKSMPSITLGHSYDWDNILTYYNPKTGRSDSGTAEQRANIAQLLLEIGCMVKMDYNTNGSGAQTGNVIVGLAKYFGYCGDTYHKSKNAYTTAQWIAMIHESIDNNCPVLYDGDSETSGGHAFVADGYDTNNRVNINFGWGGSWNGMYTFPEFDEFTESHNATFNIRPNKNGTPPVTVTGLVIKSLTSSSTSFSVNKSFSVTATEVFTEGNTAFSGTFAVWHVDGGGKLLTKLKSTSISGLDLGYYYPEITLSSCKITTSIAASDMVRAYYQRSGSSEWVPVACCPEPVGNDFIALGSNELLEAETSVDYNKESHTLKVTSDKFASFKITAASGSDIPESAYDVSGGVCTIDSSKLPGGTYNMTITAGIFSKKISFVL